MTFCIAWKTDTAAFLIADSAVTSKTPDSFNKLSDHTSFGELQGAVGYSGEFVYEKAYKIYSTDQISITFAGDAQTGDKFVTSILMHLQNNRHPEEAITLAAQNYQDISSLAHFKIALIYYQDFPKICTFDNKATPQLIPDQEFITFGSAPLDLDSYTNSFWKGFKLSHNEEKNHHNADEIFLLRMLSLLQVYGVHNYTIDKGIGGAYTGVMVNRTGTKSQPDICYVSSGENIVFEHKSTTLIKVENDHFCVVGGGPYNCTIPNGTINYAVDRNRLRASLKRAIDKFDSGRFTYLVLINTSRQSASIIEMNNQLHHRLISIDVRDDMPGTIGLVVSNELSRINNDNFEPITTPKYAQITFTSFASPSLERISFIERQLEDLRITKIHGDGLDTHKFFIYENGKPLNWYYGNLNSLFSFIKHFQHHEKIRAIDCATDMVDVEYENGKITHPVLDVDLTEILEKTPKKTRPENVYIFEITTHSQTTKIRTINIFSCNFEDASSQAQQRADSEFIYYDNLIFVGIRFYHQANAF